MLSTLLVWPVNAYRNRGWGRMRTHLSRPRLAILVGAGLLVAFVVGLLANGVADPNQFVYGYTPWLRLTLALSLGFPLAALAALAFVGLEWYRAVAARDLEASSTIPLGLAYLTALTIVLLVFVWQLWYWNLLTAVGF